MTSFQSVWTVNDSLLWNHVTWVMECQLLSSKINIISSLKCAKGIKRSRFFFKIVPKEFSNPSNSSSHISLRIICIRKNLLVCVSFILDLSPFIIIKIKYFETKFGNPMTQETFFVYVLVCHQTTRRFTPDWCQMNIFMPFRQKQQDDWLPPKIILNNI